MRDGASRSHAWVAWLRAAPASLVGAAARLPRPGPSAPGTRRGSCTEQARERDHLFAGVADATFETDRGDVDGVVAQVLEQLPTGPGGIQDTG